MAGIRPIVVVLAVGGILATAAGCERGAEREPAGPQTHLVEIRAFEYHPAVVNAAVGDTVVWTNFDAVPHTVTAAGGWDSGPIAPNASWRLVITAAAVAPYLCTYHPVMQGEIELRDGP